MFRLWIALFNGRGIDGLTYKPRAGRPRQIPPERVAGDMLPVIDDPPSAGQTHWTATKLYGWLRTEKESRPLLPHPFGITAIHFGKRPRSQKAGEFL